MKKTIFAFCGMAFISGINAGPIVNVEYIHDAIKQRWDITVPYNTELVDPGVAANRKYLLTMR